MGAKEAGMKNLTWMVGQLVAGGRLDNSGTTQSDVVSSADYASLVEEAKRILEACGEKPDNPVSVGTTTIIER